MKLLYFAWLKNHTGIGEEEIELPEDLKTVSDLLDWLPERADKFAVIKERRNEIRVAINQEFAANGDAINDADEVALFPPVTGG